MTDDFDARLALIQSQMTAPGAPFELEWVEQGGQKLAAYARACKTLPELIQSGRVHGDKPFIVYQGDNWSFTRFFAQVDALSARLREDFHLQPGDRVAIAMRNRPEWAVAFAAVALLGAVPAPLNSFGVRDELLAGLRDIEPKLLFADAERLQRLSGDLETLGFPVVVVGSAVAPALSYEELCSRQAAPVVAPELGPEDPALILFTSGATSQPKGVLSGQRALCQALCNIDYIGACAAMSSPAALQTVMQRGLLPTVLTAVPLFHVSGLHAQLLASLRNGRRLVFMHRWDPQTALSLMREHQVTQFNGAPSMVLQLLAEPGFDDKAVVGNLSGIGFGGAGLPQRAIDSVLGRVKPSLSGVGYGLTESNGVGAAVAGDGFVQRPSSSGLISPIMQLRLMELDGSEAARGQPGEVWLRGVSLMQGYWRQPEASRTALHDGWFRSGDIGVLDAAGYLSIVDRIKDVINRSGEKIAAAEIESCLLQHPEVSEAAVFAQPDLQTGEAVAAVVVLLAQSLVDAEALRRHVASRLAAYKVPLTIHLRFEALPRNPTGKLLKQQIKQQYLG
jgi:long-chain acyl-CoA synthetase